MGLFDRFLKPKKVNKPAGVREAPASKASKAPEKTAKQLATEAGEPYVAVLGMDVLRQRPRVIFRGQANEVYL